MANQRHGRIVGSGQGGARVAGGVDTNVRDPAVVLVTYSRDQDAVGLSQALSRRGVSHVLWFFDARDEELIVDAVPGRFRLQRGEQVLSTEILANARIIVHRTGVGQWRRPVVATSGSLSERGFSEREWSSLLHGLLVEAEHRYEDVTWINRPSASLLAGEKYQLLATAELDGLRVPDLRVSTEGLLPPSAGGQYICKAINEDENIDEERVYPTTVLDEGIVSGGPFRTDCPSLIQERVRAQCELRVYHLLGQLLCLRILTETSDYADMRLVPRESLSIDRVALPSSLEAGIRHYCRRHRLSYCAFDFLRNAEGHDLLVDVNPSGSWSFYESPSEPLVADWFAGTLRDKVRDPAATGLRPG
jgi:hypothetical protein